MRTGAERDAFGGIAHDIEAVGIGKQASSRLAEPNMKNTRSSGSKSTPP